MFIKGGRNDIELLHPCFVHFVVPFGHAQPCGSLNRVLGEYHPQRMRQPVSELDVGILCKQDFRPFLLLFRPLVCRLEQEIAAPDEQFGPCVPVWETERVVWLGSISFSVSEASLQTS